MGSLICDNRIKMDIENLIVCEMIDRLFVYLLFFLIDKFELFGKYFLFWKWRFLGVFDIVRLWDVVDLDGGIFLILEGVFFNEE